MWHRDFVDSFTPSHVANGELAELRLPQYENYLESAETIEMFDSQRLWGRGDVVAITGLDIAGLEWHGQIGPVHLIDFSMIEHYLGSDAASIVVDYCAEPIATLKLCGSGVTFLEVDIYSLPWTGYIKQSLLPLSSAPFTDLTLQSSHKSLLVTLTYVHIPPSLKNQGRRASAISLPHAGLQCSDGILTRIGHAPIRIAIFRNTRRKQPEYRPLAQELPIPQMCFYANPF